MIYLIRHCITDKNKDKILIGKTDAGLNEVGYNQAQSVSEYLKKKSIKKIFCSQMKRTIQTAKIIGENHDIIPDINFNLNERDLGIYEGENIKDLVDLRLSKGHVFNDSTQDWYNTPDVEQDDCIYSRVNKCISNSNFESENIIIVTHAGVIKGYLHTLLKINPKTFNCFKIRYGTIVEINFVNGYPQINSIIECHAN